MENPKYVFLIGAGFIGRHVLDLLLAAKHPVTVLVRKPEQAAEFENAGAKTVLGALSDSDLITAQTAQHEVTINTASSNDLPCVEAVLAGVRQRIDAGQPSIYIHTSGTGVLEDGANGLYKSDKIYRDDVPADIDVIPSTAMNRHVDLYVVQAARKFGDKAKIAIIIPPLVYGFNANHQRLTFVTSSIVRFAMKHGFAGYVGEGRNVWSAVHVADLGRAYMMLLSHMESAAPEALLENPYVFTAGEQEVQLREMAEHIGRILVKLGRMKSLEAKAWNESDYAELFGPFTPRGLGSNSRSRAVSLRELGWKAEEKDIWTSLEEDEIPYLLSI